MRKNNLRLSDYVYKYEGDEIKEYLALVWSTMKAAISEGLSESGVLEGGLGVQRKAAILFGQHPENETDANKENRIVCAYAFAVGEQNAAGGTVVTAPTCGACSVLPAALKYMQETHGFPMKNNKRTCRRRHYREHCKNKRLDKRCGMRMSG